ncbi:ABC transporter substrate-binding protein [Herbiconiux sp. VKM Ac-2851]|uniref:ABC transporter substrate-binding protein n=1 Tax=Herbiconiux sp. VKM Ac-2851 TaxID=2739025 RepID=UPI0020B13F77|nr:extracellular solute-binding protein [Herbiconiux sp. VKM Ac-2851]
MDSARTAKTMTASAVVLGIALGLGGCAVGTGGSATQDDTDYDSSAALSGKLTVMGFGASDDVATARLDLTKKELGSDVDVELIEGDLDIQQFLSSVASGQPPELLYANRDQIGSLAARGALLPLDACIAGEGIDTGQYRDTALAQVTFGDEIYGIPEFNGIQITMANSDLLNAAGLTLDDVNGSDPAAVTAASAALAKPDANPPVIGYDSKLPEFLPLWAKANGADLISEDGRTAQLDDPAVVDALEWAVGIYDAQGGFSTIKAVRDSADFFGSGNQFATDALGAMPMEQWYLNVLNDVSPDAPLVFDTVRDRQGQPIAYASGSAWAIPAGSENTAAACRWARVMTSVDAWQAAADARLAARQEEGKPFTGILTANVEADEAIRAMVTSGGEPWDSGVTAMYEANDHTFSLPANPADAEFKSAWQDAVNRVLNGQQEPQDALAQAQDEAQKALDKAWATLDGE